MTIFWLCEILREVYRCEIIWRTMASPETPWPSTMKWNVVTHQVASVLILRLLRSSSNYTTHGYWNYSEFAYGNEIGNLLGIKVIEAGSGHEQSPSPPTVAIPQSIIVLQATGNYATDETVTGGTSGNTGVVVSWDSARGILRLKDVSQKKLLYISKKIKKALKNNILS